MGPLGRSILGFLNRVTNHVLPLYGGVYDLGSEQLRFRNLYISGDINLGDDITVTGDVTAAGFKLTDGSALNYPVSAVAAGTVYTLTDSQAAVDFGTTDPAIVLNKAGTYLLLATASVKLNAATYAAAQSVTLKLRRTTNTAADVTGATRTVTIPVVTTATDGFDVALPPVTYTTTGPTVITDAIALYGAVSALPGAGSVTVEQANVIAVRIA